MTLSPKLKAFVATTLVFIFAFAVGTIMQWVATNVSVLVITGFAVFVIFAAMFCMIYMIFRSKFEYEAAKKIVESFDK